MREGCRMMCLRACCAGSVREEMKQRGERTEVRRIFFKNYARQGPRDRLPKVFGVHAGSFLVVECCRECLLRFAETRGVGRRGERIVLRRVLFIGQGG